MRIVLHRCLGGIEVYVYVVVDVVEGAVLLMLWMVSILFFVLM